MSLVIAEDEDYTYEILQEKHLEESTRLLAEVFTKQNPLELFMKTPYEQFYEAALGFSKAVLNEELSVVAIHKQTHEIHGIVQAGDAKKVKDHQKAEESEAAKESDSPKDPSQEPFEELDHRFMKHYGELRENELIQIMMAGVRQDCSGKGESSMQS